MALVGERTWRPAIDFAACYLSVYPSKTTWVFLSREAYWMMGRPKGVAVSVGGGRVALYRWSKKETAVRFSSSGQPYIVCPRLAAAIGAGGRAVFDYCERGRFYFRVVKKREEGGCMSPLFHEEERT